MRESALSILPVPVLLLEDEILVICSFECEPKTRLLQKLKHSQTVGENEVGAIW